MLENSWVCDVARTDKDTQIKIHCIKPVIIKVRYTDLVILYMIWTLLAEQQLAEESCVKCCKTCFFQISKKTVLDLIRYITWVQLGPLAALLVVIYSQCLSAGQLKKVDDQVLSWSRTVWTHKVKPPVSTTQLLHFTVKTKDATKDSVCKGFISIIACG